MTVAPAWKARPQSAGSGGDTRATASTSDVPATQPSTTRQQILAANSARVRWAISNNGSQTVYLGGSGVTAANGYPLAAGKQAVNRVSNAAVYAITASGTADLRVTEDTA